MEIAILKILSAYPAGHASVESLKADLAMLATAEWTMRMRALGRKAGPVRLFGARLVTRDGRGWTITDAGRNLLRRLETDEQ